MRAAEICRYRKDILSQTKRCLHSQLGEPPSLYHRIHLLISDSGRGLFANLLRGSSPIPGKPSQLFYSLHTAALNPVISPKEHFFRHIRGDLRASASADGSSSRPPSLTDLPPVPWRHAPVTFFRPKTPFLGDSLSHCGATSVHTGRDSAAAERRPAPPWVPCRQQQRSVPQVEEESPTFRYHEPQRTSIVHLQVRSKTTQKVSCIFITALLSLCFLSREVYRETQDSSMAI